MKSRSREFGCYNDRIGLKFDRHLGSAAVKFQSRRKSLNPRLRDFTRSCGKTPYRFVNRGPGWSGIWQLFPYSSGSMIIIEGMLLQQHKLKQCKTICIIDVDCFTLLLARHQLSKAIRDVEQTNIWWGTPHRSPAHDDVMARKRSSVSLLAVYVRNHPVTGCR